MALHGDYSHALRPSGYSGQVNGEDTLAEPSAPTRNPARVVGGKRVPGSKNNHSKHPLLCPVAVGRPDRYSKVKHKCIPGKTYEGLSKLNEHIRRVHSKKALCEICFEDIRGVTKELHAQKCVPTTKERDTYPTFLPDEVISEVKNWKHTMPKASPAPEGKKKGSVVRRWKHLFGIIYPGEPIPEPLLASSPSVSPEPTSSQLTSPQPASSWRSHEPLVLHFTAPPAKRRAGSEPHGRPPDSKRRQAELEAQVADEGARAVGPQLAAVDLGQPQLDGRCGVPLGGQPHSSNNPLVSPYSLDNNTDPSLPTYADAPRHIAPAIGKRSIATSETTAVTGYQHAAYTGSTAWSDTNGLLNHEDQPLPLPSFAFEDKDDPFYFLELEKEERSGTFEPVPPADYAQDLEGEDDHGLFAELDGSMFGPPN
ncbi:hypothetical protein F5144DRAFT_187117 [Chaetomium tenue]|uniref:Uncharacterized protein n=1 Tax=Chaetomium tenue TaxID=1854479 RepID=A0ACB7PCP9_9PEZI|nr:hypothetical protein F5144DRAFT_187117 [Chaetomium globosum]